MSGVSGYIRRLNTTRISVAVTQSYTRKSLIRNASSTEKLFYATDMADQEENFIETEFCLKIISFCVIIRFIVYFFMLCNF